MKVVNRNTTALVEGDKPLLLPIRKVSREFWSEKSSLDAFNGEMSVMANARFSKMECGHLPAYKVKQYIRRGSLVGVGSKTNAEMSRKSESPQNFGCLDECDQPLLLPTRYVSQQFVSEITLDTLDSDTSSVTNARFPNDTSTANARFPKLDFCEHLPVHNEVRRQRSHSLGDLDYRDLSSFATDKFTPVECAHPPNLPQRRLTGQHNTSLEEEGPRKFAAVESGEPLRLPVRRSTGQHTTSIDDPYYSSPASTRFTTATTDDQPPNLPEMTLFYRNTSNGYLYNHKLKSCKSQARKSC